MLALTVVAAGCLGSPAPKAPPSPNGTDDTAAVTPAEDGADAEDPAPAGAEDDVEGFDPPKRDAFPDITAFPAPDRREYVPGANATAVYPTFPRNRTTLERALEARASRERRGLADAAVFHGFGFDEVREESGIGFAHDAPLVSRSYRMGGAHYFHYGAVAAADVDGNGAVDLYFLNHAGPNELWLNRGDGTFRNATAEAGVAVAGQVSAGAAFGDFDGDGDADLYVATLGGPNHLFENRGGTFVDVTGRAGVAGPGYTSSALWFDHDGDGALDLYLVNLGNFTSPITGEDGVPVPTPRALGHWRDWAEPSGLYVNEGGGSFRRRSSNLSLPGRWSHDAVLVPDPGSPPDVYVLDIVGDDALFANRDGRFVEVTERRLGRTPFGSFGATVLDADGDGRFDLYVADKHSDVMVPDFTELRRWARPGVVAPMRRDHAPDVGEPPDRVMGFPADRSSKRMDGDNVYGSALYRRTDDGYREVSDRVGAETYLPWAVSAGDVNADGRRDLFLPSGQNYMLYLPDALLLNGADRAFHRASFATDLHPREGDRFTDWRTVDCPHDSPSWCRDAAGERLDGRYRVRNRRSSRGSVIADVDGDGDLDVVTNEFAARPRVLESDLMETTDRRYLAIRLEGRTAPPDGTGAVVTVRTTAGRRLHRFAGGSSGLVAQSRLPLYVGLRADEGVERVDVTWPTGDTDTYRVDGVDRTVTLRQR